MRTRTRYILVLATCGVIPHATFGADPKSATITYTDGTTQTVPPNGQDFTDEQKSALTQIARPPYRPPVINPLATLGIGSWQFPLDGQGWIVYPKAGDCKEVCVDAANGNDANAGTSLTPVKTLKRAAALLPAGKQWVLWLRAGQSYGTMPTFPGGVSANLPNVIRSWGSGRAKVDGKWAITGKSNIALVDLQLTGGFTGKGVDAYGVTFFKCSNVILEGCDISGYADGVIGQSADNQKVSNLLLHRNVIHDQTAPADNSVHSEGVYIYNWDGVLFEGNVFNCNGWRPNPLDPTKPLVQKTIFNHNVYMNGMNWHVTDTNNLSANSSAMGWQDRPGGDDSYYVSIDNPVGLTWGIVHGNGPGHPGGCVGSLTHAVFHGGADIGKEPRGIALTVGNAAQVKLDHVYFVDPHLSTQTAAVIFEKAYGTDTALKTDVGVINVNATNVFAVDWPKTVQFTVTPKAFTAKNCFIPGVDTSAGRPAKVVTVDDYAKSIGLKDAQDLVQAANQQSRANWRKELEAASIVKWIESNWK